MKQPNCSKENYKSDEKDPHGLSAGDPGSKLDAGKVDISLVMSGFAMALWEVSKVGHYGHYEKGYARNGWKTVKDGIQRYDSAEMRHKLKEWMGIERDSDSKILHAAHAAWNSLAKLQLLLEEKKERGEYKAD